MLRGQYKNGTVHKMKKYKLRLYQNKNQKDIISLWHRTWSWDKTSGWWSGYTMFQCQEGSILPASRFRMELKKSVWQDWCNRYVPRYWQFPVNLIPLRAILSRSLTQDMSIFEVSMLTFGLYFWVQNSCVSSII